MRFQWSHLQRPLFLCSCALPAQAPLTFTALADHQQLCLATPLVPQAPSRDVTHWERKMCWQEGAGSNWALGRLCLVVGPPCWARHVLTGEVRLTWANQQDFFQIMSALSLHAEEAGRETTRNGNLERKAELAGGEGGRGAASRDCGTSGSWRGDNGFSPGTSRRNMVPLTPWC